MFNTNIYFAECAIAGNCPLPIVYATIVIFMYVIH